MEDTEIINLWKAQNEKIEHSLSINRELLVETINQKAQTALRSLIRLKTAGIISFVLYLTVLSSLLFYAVVNYSTASNYFIVSISAIILINLKGFADYIKHLIWTNNIEYDGSITKIQHKLSKLQLSIINHTRIMYLQFPFWTTIYLSGRWFPQSVGLLYIVFQIVLTGAFTYFAYWLYKVLKVENLDKKWLQRLVAGSGGKSVKKALEFYKEIETFQREY